MAAIHPTEPIMHPTRRTLVLSLSAGAMMLAGCAVTGRPDALPANAPHAASYFALGTEPGWTVEITDNRVKYAGDYGATIIDTEHSGERRSGATRRYVTKDLRITIEPGPCSDGMSDRRYSDKVTLSVRGQTLSGCGGPILPVASLAGTNWKIVAVDGRPAIEKPEAVLRFTETGVSGSTGCNRFSGSFTAAEQAITFGPLGLTRMACAEPAMAQENVVMAVLNNRVAVDYDDAGRMILTAADGRTLTLIRLI